MDIVRLYFSVVSQKEQALPIFQPHPEQDKFYDQLADSWWDKNGVLHLLKSMVNPWRVPYFEKIILHKYGRKLRSVHLLDLGSGGGLLAEEFYKIGLNVSGIDLSAKSIQTAASHAKSFNIKINYQVGSAVTLPFSDQSFDIVACCDVLEHIPDWRSAIQETSRVLKPNGIFLFDTINRTVESYILMKLGAEIIPFTRFFPKGTHIWRQFIKPTELAENLNRNNLICKDITGGKPTLSILETIFELIKLNLGQTTIKQLGERIYLQPTNTLDLNYIGYAVKNNSQSLSETANSR